MERDSGIVTAAFHGSERVVGREVATAVDGHLDRRSPDARYRHESKSATIVGLGACLS
jgi:hypothetical protein